jgi:hypothetical protein
MKSHIRHDSDTPSIMNTDENDGGDYRVTSGPEMSARHAPATHAKNMPRSAEQEQSVRRVGG